MLNNLTLSVRSQELRSKGSFIISPEGHMTPKTRHSTIWGKIDYSLIGGLSNEVVGRLNKTRPETIGAMMRMIGITPAAVTAVIAYLKK